MRIRKTELSPLCKGRELHGYASCHCLNTSTSRTCRWSPHPLVCSPFSPQGRALRRKHASTHEPAPSGFLIKLPANQIENCHAQRNPALLAAAHADEEGVEAVGLAVLAVSGGHPLEPYPTYVHQPGSLLASTSNTSKSRITPPRQSQHKVLRASNFGSGTSP